MYYEIGYKSLIFKIKLLFFSHKVTIDAKVAYVLEFNGLRTIHKKFFKQLLREGI